MQNRNSSQRRIAVNKERLWRFAMGIWSAAAIIVALVPWPYGMVTVLLATCVHFAALEGR